MKLHILGSSGGFPSADNPNSGYLLEEGNTRIWLDAGTGSFAALQRLTDYAALDALLLSHLHADHCVDVYPLHIALAYERKAQIRMLARPGALEHLGRLLGDNGADKLREVFVFQEIDEGKSAEIGGIRFSFRRTDHPVYTLAVRAEADSGVLVFSADTGPKFDLSSFAEGCDLLLCEATYSSEHHGEPVHLSAAEAGETAARAGARRLLLTHLWPTINPETSLAEARAAAQGIPVDWARPGNVHAVKRP